MIHLTRPDAAWLLKLLEMIEAIHEDYPELFSEDDEDDLQIAGELIRSINK